MRDGPTRRMLRGGLEVRDFWWERLDGVGFRIVLHRGVSMLRR